MFTIIIDKPAAEWTAENQILPPNTFGREFDLDNGSQVDTLKVKLGDGVTHWVDLDYYIDPGAIVPAPAAAINAGTEESQYITPKELADSDYATLTEQAAALALKADGTPGVKVYRALLSQSAGAAPAATVLENSFGAAIVWARAVDGEYTGTLASAFTVDKTFLLVATPVQGNGLINVAELTRTSENVVTLSTLQTDAGTPAGNPKTDTILNETAVEILVYP